MASYSFKKMYFLGTVSIDFLYNLMKLFSFPEDFSKLSLTNLRLHSLHVKCMILLSDLTKHELPSHMHREEKQTTRCH